jgi:hypothetical protein
MPKFEKYFDWEDCPLCGSNLIVKTDCDPDNDTEEHSWYQDGDFVMCENDSCLFESELSVDEENGDAWVKETYEED